MNKTHPQPKQTMTTIINLLKEMLVQITGDYRSVQKCVSSYFPSYTDLNHCCVRLQGTILKKMDLHSIQHLLFGSSTQWESQNHLFA